jgi:GntR family transcriptional repressor for pyruvate dehydrogenase complex
MQYQNKNGFAVATRLFEDICIAIRRQIAHGALRPGDKLPSERELAEEFAVGRPVIREALRSLEEAGILEFRRGVTGGAFIRTGDSATMIRAVSDLIFLGAISLENLTEARALLLRHTAELAAQRGTEEDFLLLEADIDAISQIDIYKDEQHTVASVAHFYDLLGFAAKNEMLVFLIHSVSEVVGQVLIKTRPDAMGLVVASRRRLMRHLRDRQAINAGAEIVAHLSELHNAVLESAARLHTLQLEPAFSSRLERTVG